MGQVLHAHFDRASRLRHTWHRMADDVLLVLRTRVGLLDDRSPTGFRMLTPDQLAVFEYVLAPLAEVGTALPSDPFIRRLWATQHSSRAEDLEWFGSFDDIRQAWGPSQAANVLEAYIHATAARAWRDNFGCRPPREVLPWISQFAYLFIRPEDLAKLPARLIADVREVA